MTTDKVPWEFDLNVYLKPEENPLYGNLKLIKQVQLLEDRLNDQQVTPMTAVFKVTGYNDDDEIVYQNVASVTVPSEKQYVILKHIPVGTRIVVEEIYSGSGYKYVSGPDPEEVIIVKALDDDPEKDTNIVSVTFVDTYDNELKKGYGVQNSFDKVNGEWQWTNDLHGSQGGDE